MNFGPTPFPDEREEVLEYNTRREVLGPPIWTTFLTSLWVWAVIGGTAILRLLTRIAPAAEFLRDKLDIENRPFRSLGVMMGVVMVLPYWVFKLALSAFTG